ncbi:MAG: hypothetical protein ACYC4H_04950 [Desulfocucumaceae bacterium]
MYKYKCPICQGIIYSAARPEQYSSPTCPYCGCNLFGRDNTEDMPEGHGEKKPVEVKYTD